MRKIIYITLASTFLLFSCTEKIELDLNNQDFKRVVVEGSITNETKAHEVKLTWTSDYFQNEQAEPVSGATLSLSDGTSSFNLLEDGATGRYYTDASITGIVGKTYELVIENDGEMYVASEFLASVPEVEMIDVAELEPAVADSAGLYEVLLWAQEEEGVDNWYLWKIFVNGESRNDSLSNFIFTPDQGSDGAYLDGVTIEEVDAFPGDTIILEQYSNSEKAHDIWLAMLFETDFRGGLFDTPPANVETNISNGALGYFGAFAVSRDTVIVP